MIFKVKRLLIVTAVILNLISCTTTQIPVPDVVFPPESKNILSIEKKGMLIKIDHISSEWIESSELSVLPKDIIPVFVVIENHNTEPFFIPKSSFTLVKNGDSVSPLTTFTHTAERTGLDAVAGIGNLGHMLGIVVLSLPLVVVGGGVWVVADQVASDRRHNTERKLLKLIAKELKEKALAKGDSISGFLFFKLQQEDIKKVSEIQAKAVILRTEESVAFAITFKGGF